MKIPYRHERRRTMRPDKKVKFCQLIRESRSLEEAALFGEPPGAPQPAELGNLLASDAAVAKNG